MIGVVQQIIPRIGVQKNYQPVPINRQPWQYDAEQFGAESQLAAPVGVRADRPLVHAAHADAKLLRGFFTQGARLFEGAGIKVNVGVIALDSLHKHLLKNGLLSLLKAVKRCVFGTLRVPYTAFIVRQHVHARVLLCPSAQRERYAPA